MIGALLSLKWFGKKSWVQSLIFWVAYLIVLAIVSSLLYMYVSPTGSILGLVVGFAVFMALAHYWYKYQWVASFKLFAFAFVIDMVIAVILFGILAIVVPDWWSSVFPLSALL